jgi:hypothetical protein
MNIGRYGCQKYLHLFLENFTKLQYVDLNQGCGSGSGLDPDSETCVDPDPYWESGSRGKKTKKFQWKNALFSYF